MGYKAPQNLRMSHPGKCKVSCEAGNSVYVFYSIHPWNRIPSDFETLLCLHDAILIERFFNRTVGLLNRRFLTAKSVAQSA